MNRTCDPCGQTFETLSGFRLHKADCPGNEVVDLSGMDVDEISQEIVDDLLICHACERKNSGTEQLGPETVDGSLALVARYVCEHCETDNETTAILEP